MPAGLGAEGSGLSVAVSQISGGDRHVYLVRSLSEGRNAQILRARVILIVRTVQRISKRVVLAMGAWDYPQATWMAGGRGWGKRA